MKRLEKIMALVSCALVACLTIVGCSANKPENREAFLGTWEIAAMTVDGEESSEEDMLFIRALPEGVSIELRDDGTYTLNLLGDVDEGTWEATGEGTGKLTAPGGSDMEMTIDGGELVVTDRGDVMRFEKEDADAEEGGAEEDDADEADEADDAEDADDAADDTAEAEDDAE